MTTFTAKSRCKTQHATIAFAVAVALTGICASSALGKEAVSSPPLDPEREFVLADTDNDGYPDPTEEIGGTDPFDAASNPRALTRPPRGAEKVGFPTSSCRPGFTLAGTRLCITGKYGPSTVYRNYELAAATCRNDFARVCTYEDFFYLFNESDLDRFFNPYGSYIGNIVADDSVLCGNRDIYDNNVPAIWNFEGSCARVGGSNSFFCCHDRE